MWCPVAGQREIEPTQLSKVKANCKTSTPDDETTAKEAAVDSPGDYIWFVIIN